MAEAATVMKGLEGVIADTTAISHVDGAVGKLYYRGYPIEALVQHRFVEVMHLVVFGDLPDAARRAETEEYLWDAGRLPPRVVDALRTLAALQGHPMATLQAIAPLLALDAPAVRLGRTNEEEEGMLVGARLPAAIAAILATRRNAPPVPYPATRSYGERYLRLLTGRVPTPQQVDALECTQILQLEHSFNASTFTARGVTSTLSPPASALAAAMAALYGPLHGAADQAALEMAMEVGDPQRASEFVAKCLATGRMVMGMGHREYRVVDPRAQIIKAMTEAVVTEPEQRRLLETLQAVDAAFVEQTATKRRVLRANLEFYKGILYLALGIPKEFFTATFAAARVFGWAAHIVEQRKDNRIIRPSAQYVGPPLRTL
jgi:citrate synthase